jgi:hypothetical protein
MMAERVTQAMHQDPKSLLPPAVRCFAQPTRSGQWQAFSLEFGLAVQADTYPEVKRKILDMINSYAHEALTIDREHAAELLTRKASIPVHFRFYVVRALSAVVRWLTKQHLAKNGMAVGRTFLDHDLQGCTAR